MDNVSKKFDDWAINGKAESMEKGHGINVLKFLKKISFDKPFSFLDVGCGNGWVIRYVSDMPTCKKAIGIDKSKKMIIQANKKINNNKESFVYWKI
jgi:ubiquinone/menaquinone biosynthesis C-methylase UbiE